ncbi:MAG: energy transducer TonB [Thermonemataceae bacterium]|nr:energy transducer TonB [Thermonemataceae bacterium]
MKKNIFFLLFFVSSFTLKAQDVLKSAEQMPEPVGGLKAFYDYISANMKYPQEAKAKKVEGRVHITFVVEPDGSLTNIQVSKSLEANCDNEAIRLLKNAPKWNPGRQNGSKVRVEVTRPITFKLP